MTHDELVAAYPLGSIVCTRTTKRAFVVTGHNASRENDPWIREGEGEWWSLWQIEKVTR